MKTPLSDFIKKYKNENNLRLHMPGHKGKGFLGTETGDITEIPGADVLYQEDGVLKESQEITSLLFHSKKTLFSTEGSSLCIRAMLYLALVDAKSKGKKCIIASPKNAHKTFLSGCAMMDLDPMWIPCENAGGLFGSKLTPENLTCFLGEIEDKPTAVYVTSPDYLGNVLDISELAKICHENNALLLVDNAHGAYLNFLPEALHPISLGADLVCDSAHKTLPVLTGGAYLHLSENVSDDLASVSPVAMSFFASTSPSYLILESLDLCNDYLSKTYPKILYPFLGKIVDFKKELKQMGWQLFGNEPMKITLQTKSMGYLGTEVANFLLEDGITAEFSDPDYLVMMLTPEMKDSDLERIKTSLSKIKERTPILDFCPAFPLPKKVLSPREAMLAPSEEIGLSECVGRILSSPSVSCPPAVPVVICGEEIQKDHIEIFRYYNIEKLFVTKKI